MMTRESAIAALPANQKEGMRLRAIARLITLLFREQPGLKLEDTPETKNIFREAIIEKNVFINLHSCHSFFDEHSDLIITLADANQVFRNFLEASGMTYQEVQDEMGEIKKIITQRTTERTPIPTKSDIPSLLADVNMLMKNKQSIKLQNGDEFPIAFINNMALSLERANLIKKIQERIGKVESDLSSEADTDNIDRCNAKIAVLVQAVFSLANFDRNILNHCQNENPRYNENRNSIMRFFGKTTDTQVLINNVEDLLNRAAPSMGSGLR